VISSDLNVTRIFGLLPNSSYVNASHFDYVAAVAQVCALCTKVFSNTVAQLYSSNSTIIRAVFPFCQILAAQSLEFYTCNCRKTQQYNMHSDLMGVIFHFTLCAKSCFNFILSRY
jgi:hypothetical protein